MHALKYGLEQNEGDRRVVLKTDLGLVHVKCSKFESEEAIISSSGAKGLITWAADIENLEVLHSFSGHQSTLSGKEIYEDV